MKIAAAIFLIFVFISGCSKMEEKKSAGENKPPVNNTSPEKTPESNLQKQTESAGAEKKIQTDDKAAELSKTADEALTKYASDKSEATKKEVIEKCMAAATYLEFEANLPAREKYRPALNYYRKVLELDPENVDARKNKKEIEDIYNQMGMPVPN